MKACIAWFAAALLGANPSTAWAESKVRINADVILASNNGTVIDPPSLARMKAQFSQKGFAFTSYRRLSSEKLALGRQAVQLKLPNQRTASLRLDSMKNGVATVRVDISDLSSTTLSMGREGSLFQHAGEHDGGQLILVLSPDHGAQPRHAVSALSRPAEGVARELTGDAEALPQSR